MMVFAAAMAHAYFVDALRYEGAMPMLMLLPFAERRLMPIMPCCRCCHAYALPRGYAAAATADSYALRRCHATFCRHCFITRDAAEVYAADYANSLLTLRLCFAAALLPLSRVMLMLMIL